ncbi:MAG: class I SAM-dependent methyltransferase [Bacillota bacterium]|jgi:2-polyprenyl-3-methyl-5-hydroxy-6-metoxy-1,4-benzoquinol methylase
MNEQAQEKLARSLTSNTVDIIPFLPYLLQDLWELGSSPSEMLSLIQSHIRLDEDAYVLDLGCGKGAVSIQLAKGLKCLFKGIDLIPDFVEYAREKAKEYDVSSLCEFEVGDIAEAVKKERCYDLVIYGAVGDVLPGRFNTLKALADTVKPGGHILIDDAYLPEKHKDGLRFQCEYPTLHEWKTFISEAGLEFIAHHVLHAENPKNAQDLMNIKRRAGELSRAYPAKREMFAQYVLNQQDEYEDLESHLVGVVFLLARGKAR